MGKEDQQRDQCLLLSVEKLRGKHELLAGVMQVQESRGERELLAGVMWVQESRGERELLVGRTRV